MKYIYYLVFGGLVTMNQVAAQSGCTDIQATNFNPQAVQNDGSCIYPETFITTVFQANLPGTLKETSGLTRAAGAWWTHNDSGNSNDFYNIDPISGDILKTIKLKEATHVDWEDICSDGTSLYLGDFGNNSNDRTNLGFYKIPLNTIGNGSNQTIQPEEYTFFSFAYPDQTEFGTQPEDSTVFDCEAAVFSNGLLHLFTKNHRDYSTTHYTLNPDNQQIEKIGTLQTQGMISGASISPDGKMIVLTGYNLIGLPSVFCWMLWDWPAGTNLFFEGNKRKLELGSALLVGQVESIGFLTNRSGFIANERTTYNGITLVNESIRQFNVNTWAPETTPTQSPNDDAAILKLSPNPVKNTLNLDWGVEAPEALEIIHCSGVIESAPVSRVLELDLPAGVYWLRARFGMGAVLVRPFLIQ